MKLEFHMLLLLLLVLPLVLRKVGGQEVGEITVQLLLLLQGEVVARELIRMPLQLIITWAPEPLSLLLFWVWDEEFGFFFFNYI